MPLSRSQVREVDRRSIEEFHIPGIVLMENAARSAAELAWEMIGGQAASVLVLCGGGNNGGDGLALARHLHNFGANVSLALTIDPGGYKGDALINWQIISAMKLAWRRLDPLQLTRSSGALIVDAIFGTGLEHAPREPFGQISAAIRDTGIPVLAIDVPSGMDCDTGLPLGTCIAATRTITFVDEKLGFANPLARSWLGQVSVASIGCPRELIDQVLRR